MMCAWDAYIHLLPVWMRETVDKQGRESLQELRMRINYPAQMVFKNKSICFGRDITVSDIQFVINAASRYSPWCAETLKHGYITALGGHRIGVCGEAVTESDELNSLRNANMLSLRVARDFVGIATGIDTSGMSVLIIGGPGCGKTTLLRDMIRTYSQREDNNIGVVDERHELFPMVQGRHTFEPGAKTDVLSGVRKEEGVEMLIRCMTPSVIAVDEITSKDDCAALIGAGWCGVRIFATAHAGDRKDLYRRQIYRPLIESGIFDLLVIMNRDKSWNIERMSAECFV